MDELFTALLQDESGQDMAEYGLLLALIAIATVVAIEAFSGAISAKFTEATTILTGS